jgi:hypothetical protein
VNTTGVVKSCSGRENIVPLSEASKASSKGMATRGKSHALRFVVPFIITDHLGVKPGVLSKKREKAVLIL